jgi:hypothetical protein
MACELQVYKINYPNCIGIGGGSVGGSAVCPTVVRAALVITLDGELIAPTEANRRRTAASFRTVLVFILTFL